MQRSAFVCQSALLGALVVAAPATSHHSNVYFEVTKVINITGTLGSSNE
ncbi:MAG: hypothetical protein ABIT36_06170 [Steroidobacteraceae bacterium]